MDRIARKMILAAALCAGLARCEPPLSSQYGVPGNYAGPGPQGSQYQQHQQHQQHHQYQQQQPVTNSYGAPLGDGHGHDEHQDYIDSQPKSYEFGYAVKDAASGNDFGRRETSDGETVRGEYRVQLPDGRTQIVSYTADWRTGFHADVRYEGVAQYPEQYNGNNQGYAGNGNGGGYDYSGNNNIDAGYSSGNQGGYNNYQDSGSGAGYGSGGSSYNYQYGSNAVDGGQGGGGGGGPGSPGSFGSPAQPTYGVPFH